MGIRQLGFSIAEITAGLVVLAILVFFALPYISSMRSETLQVSLQALASHIENSSARNHAIDIAVEEGLTTTVTDPFVNVDNCTDGRYFLPKRELPKSYTIQAMEVQDQVAVTCQLIAGEGVKADFVIIGALGGVDRS